MPRAGDKGKLSVEDAIGPVHVLVVGVSEYNPASNFGKLRQCEHDATAVALRFSTKLELLGSPERVRVLSSSGHEKPTKGRIIGEARALASTAGPDDRLVFYFSGHGHRIKDVLYLVPEDAYADDEADALVSFDVIAAVLSNSEAKVKIAILDACNTGPDLSTLKNPAAKLSEKFLAEYIRQSKGIVTLASSLQDQPSSTKSPDPTLSLFTHFLVKALDGDAEALNAGLLTAQSLHDYVSVAVQRVSKSHHRLQQPTISVANSGMLVLGNYRAKPRVVSEAGTIARTRIVLRFEERGRVGALSGFDRSRGHTIPAGHAPATSTFVKKIGEAEVRVALKETFARIKKALRLKQSDLEFFDVEGGVGSIRAPGFIYGVMIDQDPADESGYVITRSIDDATMAGDAAFEDLFETEFNACEIRLEDPDVSAVIAALEDHDLEPACSPDSANLKLSIATGVTILVDDNSLVIQHRAPKAPSVLVRVLDQLLGTSDIGPALAIALRPKPKATAPSRFRVPVLPTPPSRQPLARSPPTAQPFRWTVASVGNVFSERTTTQAQRVLTKADADRSTMLPASTRLIRVFPASSPETVLVSSQLKTLAQTIEIAFGKSSLFPFAFAAASSSPYTEGRAWSSSSESPRREFVVGNDGAILYREGLWEETFPRDRGILRGDEFGACSTFELIFKAVRYVQRLIPSFSKPVERCELIVDLAGISKKRFLCDPADFGALRLDPFIATTVSSEQSFSVGATFARDLTDKELLLMCAELLGQIANIFDASDMVGAVAAQSKRNLGVS